jgi:CheY-like chemotaxis protein
MAEKTILVVDDNDLNRDVERRILRHLGYEADVAESGLQALEMAGRTRYPMVLMDLTMPGMDGFEAARRMRELEGYREARIIALTGADPDCLGLEAAIFNEVAEKPLSMESLRELVERHLGR